jgi:hypothetical protein
MNDTARLPHPSPHAGRVSGLALGLGLWLAPAAWFLQLSIDTWVASHACYPRDVPFLVPQSALSLVMAPVDAVALVLALAGGFIAWRSWRATRAEKPGRGHELIASGEGRARFMAMAGMLTTAMVLMAMVYAALVHALMGGCGT